MGHKINLELTKIYMTIFFLRKGHVNFSTVHIIIKPLEHIKSLSNCIKGYLGSYFKLQTHCIAGQG